MPIYTIIFVVATILGFVGFGLFGGLAGFLIAAFFVGVYENIFVNTK